MRLKGEDQEKMVGPSSERYEGDAEDRVRLSLLLRPNTEWGTVSKYFFSIVDVIRVHLNC